MTSILRRSSRATRDAARRSPDVSVLVATYLGVAHLGRCLGSLAEQTLPSSRYEIVIVPNGPDDGSKDVIAEFRTAYPRLRVRVIESAAAGAAQARNIALHAARGDYVTYVDDDDWVSPGFLAALLDRAGPDVVAVAPMGDHPADAAPGVVDFDTYVGRALAKVDGQTLRADRLLTVFSYNAAKLVHRELAGMASYRQDLHSGEDLVYWLELFARRPFQVSVVPQDQDAHYIRALRSGSLGRQVRGYDFSVRQRLDCLAAIEAVPRSAPPVERVCTYLSRAQAGWINGYLHAHPADWQRVYDDVQRRGLTRVPWERINEGLARELAITYCFPPDLDTSALVAARRIRERGALTDVISQDLGKLRVGDPDSMKVCDPFLGRRHVVGGPVSFARWPAMSAFAGEVWSTFTAWESEQGPYRAIYSRAMAVNSHLAAALVKLRRPGVVWTAEFSDPLSTNTEGRRRPSPVEEDWLSEELLAGLRNLGFSVSPDITVYELAELLPYALADALVFTNEQQLAYMVERCPFPALAERIRAVATVAPHPTLPPEFYELGSPHVGEELDPRHVNIGYFGVFYATRGLDDVLDALARLTHAEQQRVRLHVFTSRPNVLRVEVIRRGLAGIVLPQPFVGFLDYLRLTTKMDALLVNDTTSHGHSINPYLPSKVSDYRGSGRPIWAIVEPGSVLSTLPVAYRSRIGDVDSVLTALRAMLNPEDGSEAVAGTSPDALASAPARVQK